MLYPFDDGDKEKLRPGIILNTKDNRSIVLKSDVARGERER